MKVNTREYSCQDFSNYLLPVYTLGESGIEKVSTFQLSMFQGAVGFRVEHILEMLVYHLGSLNVGELRNRHTSVAITKLEEAWMWALECAKNVENGVFNDVKRNFGVIKEGATYELPFEFGGENSVMKIGFVKGNIEGPEFRQDGIITENLLCALAHYVTDTTGAFFDDANYDMPNIYHIHNKIMEALFWMEQRKRDRMVRGVLGTYKK